MTGPGTPVPHNPADRPGYRYDDDDWVAATAFDWIEQPLTAIADASSTSSPTTTTRSGMAAPGGHRVNERS